MYFIQRRTNVFVSLPLNKTMFYDEYHWQKR